jgi:hypothetical protein
MIFSKIDLIKMVRKITVPHLGLVDAKNLVESIYINFAPASGIRLEQYSDLEPLINVCYAYNSGVFTYNEEHDMLWGKNPIVSPYDLVAISKEPNRFIGS